MSDIYDERNTANMAKMKKDPSVQRQLLQFCKSERGLGHTKEWDVGWEINFGLTPEQRKKFDELVESGQEREDALALAKVLVPR